VFSRVSRFSVRRSSPNFISTLDARTQRSLWFTKRAPVWAISCSGRAIAIMIAEGSHYSASAAGANHPSSSARFSNNTARLVSKNEDGECWAGRPSRWAALGVVAFPRGYEETSYEVHWLFTCCVAFRDACSTILKLIRSEKRLNPTSLLPCLRKIRKLCGKASAPRTDPRFRRGTAGHFGTSIVTNSTGFSKVGSKHSHPKTRSARHSPRRQVRHHHRHRHIVQKDAPTIS